MLPVLLGAFTASAYVDPKCADYQLRDDYDEQSQQDFLANYVTLATTLSPQHAPIPHAAGHGAIGVDLAIIPPLGCRRRLVLNGTKTEDTNKTPVAPRIRASFAFPEIGKLRPYAGVAYIPPVPFLGTRNVIVSGELGVGVELGEKAQLGGRYHFTMQKTIGEIATPFNIEDPSFEDLYLGSSFGVDAMFGYALGAVTPYVAAGVTDVSTFFYIGDTSISTNNLHPYFGPVASLGVDGLVKERFRFGAELYTAPGGFSKPDPTAESVGGFGRYGNITTARIRLALEL
ncbi:MAG: hypothetical protein KC656_15680 [Myxococcales bacterium]|nr:hypothetical protein [Myxococcales bacterium]